MLTVNNIYNSPKSGKINQRASENLELAQKLIPDGQSIVYFSDFHSNVSNLPRLSGLIYRIQKQLRNEKLFKICSGDFLLGTEARNSSIISNFFNKIKLSFLTPGNHEFDAPRDKLKAVFNSFKFPVIASNTKNTELPVKAATILKSQLGKFGAVGITVTSDDDKNHDGLISYEETKAAVQNKVNMLTGAGINRIILASHLGFEKDKKLAQETSGLDVIISAHDHISINGVQEGKNLVKSKSNEPVAIFQAGENNETLGYARVAFDKNGILNKIFNKTIPVSANNASEDKELARLISRENSNRPLAKLASPASIKDINCNESALANWLADSIRSELQTPLPVILPSRMIRTGLSAGVIREIDINEMLPIRKNQEEETYKTIYLTGKHLKNFIQRMTVLEDAPGGRQLLHVSGLKYSVNSDYRVTDLMIQVDNNRFKPVEDGQSYQIILPGYLLSDRIKNKVGLENAKLILDSGKTAPQIITDYLKKHPQVINLNKERRILLDSLIESKIENFIYPEFLNLTEK